MHHENRKKRIPCTGKKDLEKVLSEQFDREVTLAEVECTLQHCMPADEDAPLGVADGFTPEQRFFLAYASVWAGNIRDEEIRNLTKSDPHSLGRWRVNAALPHIDAWYEAFGITENDPLFVPKEKRAVIW